MKQEYKKAKGFGCIVCKSKEVIYEELEFGIIDQSIITERVSCADCGAEWIDEFKLNDSYIDIKDEAI